MGITTKTGDSGKTTIKNKVVEKDDIIIELLGTIDEAIASLVVAYHLIHEEEFKEVINDLSLIGAIVAGYQKEFKTAHIEKLDRKIAFHLDVHDFSYPYDSYEKSVVNLSRTVVRRLERVYHSYRKKYLQDDNIAAYLNRLSDYLYCFL